MFNGIYMSTTGHEMPRASTQVTVKSNLRIGIGGPIGSGKTALVARLCRPLAGDLELVVNIMQEENRHEEVKLDINRDHRHPNAVDLGDGWIECTGKDTGE